MRVEDLLTKVQTRFSSKVTCKLENAQLTIEIRAEDLLVTCLALRDESDFQFEQLMDLCAVDYLCYGIGDWATTSTTSEGFSRGVEHNVIKDHLHASKESGASARYAVVYHLLSITQNQRIRIRVFVGGEAPRITTVVNIWSSANWYEREAFDLFGILFDGHADLRRILTDYGFIGHPFRKDFPLIGQVEMRYDAAEERVVYEPVSIQPRTLVPKVVRYVGSDAKEGTS